MLDGSSLLRKAMQLNYALGSMKARLNWLEITRSETNQAINHRKVLLFIKQGFISSECSIRFPPHFASRWLQPPCPLPSKLSLVLSILSSCSNFQTAKINSPSLSHNFTSTSTPNQSLVMLLSFLSSPFLLFSDCSTQFSLSLR